MKIHAPSDLARLIKNARNEQELTQQEVADAVGITRQSLARIERGNGGVSFDTVIAILDHLNITLDACRVAEPVPEVEVGREAENAKSVTAGSFDLAAATEFSQRHSPAPTGISALYNLSLPKIDTSAFTPTMASAQRFSERHEAAFKAFDASVLASISGSQKAIRDAIAPLSNSLLKGTSSLIPGSVITHDAIQHDASSVHEITSGNDTTNESRDGECQ